LEDFTEPSVLGAALPVASGSSLFPETVVETSTTVVPAEGVAPFFVLEEVVTDVPFPTT
jgi:hypothetical protein